VRTIALLVALLAAACTVGPDYAAPQAATPADWAEPLPPGAVAQPDEAALARWWTAFGDPELDALVEAAVARNRDLAAAGARVREARALRAAAGAGWLPSLDSSAGVTRTHRSGNAFPAGPVGTTSDLHTVGLDAAWELDLFGGVRRTVEAADADLAAAQEDQRAVLVTLLGEVGLSWVDARAARRRLAIARGALAAQQETADLTRARRDAGLANDLDLARAEALVAGTQATLPALQEQRARAGHSLDVLTGGLPGTAQALLGDEPRVPPPPARVPLGLPSDLLRRRPDLRRAERELAAATARIGVAQADRWPKFTLTGALGRSSQVTRNLFEKDSEYWALGAGLDWPLFEGGRLAAEVEAADARAEQALRAWEQAVLVALQETHDALTGFGREQERRAALERAAAAQRETAQLARERHAAGLSDFLEVLDAERSLLTAEDAVALSEQALAADAVALYKALGGGWEQPVEAGEAAGAP